MTIKLPKGLVPPATQPQAPRPDVPLWPEPDTVYTEEDRKTVAVLGGAVSRVRFGSQWAVFSVVVLENDRPIGFRFRVPKHKRLVRDFLKAGGLHQTPSEGAIDVTEGLFLVQFEGVVIGQDVVPKGLPPGMPEELHVVEVTEAHVIQPSQPIPEA